MNRLLLCLDGSRYSEVCCRYAAVIAAQTGASIHGLYVSDLYRYEVPAMADIGGCLGAQPFNNLIAQLTSIEDEKARTIEAAARAVLTEYAMEPRFCFEHKTALLVDAVAELEAANNFDLIILGKRGENADFASKHLGSAMERVVRASTAPCFICNRQYDSVHRVLFAYDGSPTGRRALERLATTTLLDEKELHVVTVNDNRDERRSLQNLTEAEAALIKRPFKLVTQMLTGDVENNLCAYCDEQDIDLLVMGAYGHSRLRELLIGSTTSHLMRLCRIPVFISR